MADDDDDEHQRQRCRRRPNLRRSTNDHPLLGNGVGGWLARTSAQTLAQAPLPFNQIPHARNSVVANLSSVCKCAHTFIRTLSLSLSLPAKLFLFLRVIRSSRVRVKFRDSPRIFGFSHILILSGRGGGGGEGDREDFRGEIGLNGKWKEFSEFVGNVSQGSMSRIVRMDYTILQFEEGGRNIATWSIDYRELGGGSFRLERKKFV